MPVMEAVVTAGNIHTRTHRANPGLRPVHNNIGASFWMYRGLISKALMAEEPATSDAAALLLGELHGRFASYWVESFTPGASMGYKLGGSALTDEFIQAAAGKQAGVAGAAINEVSDRAFLEGYNAALNKGWERAVAWQRISEAYGVDPRQMRRWVTGYPTDGYHPGTLPKESRSLLMRLLLDRSERIAGHESWSAFQMGRAAELAALGESIDDLTKRWVTAGDERVCDSCGPMHGTTIGAAERFTTDQGSLYAPPLHMNCRCNIVADRATGVVTKRMGADEYDRDSSGKFSTDERRGAKKRGTSAQWSTVTGAEDWSPSETVAPSAIDTLPDDKDITASNIKADAEELITQLKDTDSLEIPTTAGEKKIVAAEEKTRNEQDAQRKQDALAAFAEYNAQAEHQIQQQKLAEARKVAEESAAAAEEKEDELAELHVEAEQSMHCRSPTRTLPKSQHRDSARRTKKDR
jgi:hypothetical protein